MRFRLHISLVNMEQNMMPLNYQYELSSWIYKTVNLGDKNFTNWLYKNGYTTYEKKFRLFTFSSLIVPKYKHLDDRLFINSEKVYFILSFQMEEAIEPYIINLFRNQRFSLGDKKSRSTFQVKYVEKLNDPDFSGQMTFRTLSPIMISKPLENRETDKTISLPPESLEFEKILFGNLNNKYLASLNNKNTKQNQLLFSHSGKTSFELLNVPKSRLIKIKADTPEENLLKGYLFDFKITAPVHLLKTGYHCGFGEKNSLGFGCVELVSGKG